MNYNRNRSSRSSYFRSQKDRRDLEKAAVGSLLISNFFVKPGEAVVETSFVAENILTESIMSLTETIKLHSTKTSEYPAWKLLQSLAVLRYLELIQNGTNKMSASFEIAKLFYNSKTVTSYKCHAIRQWAKYYEQNKSFTEVKQGIFQHFLTVVYNVIIGHHYKSKSVIRDVDVQIRIRQMLREIADINRTPEVFMQTYNSIGRWYKKGNEDNFDRAY